MTSSPLFTMLAAQWNRSRWVLLGSVPSMVAVCLCLYAMDHYDAVEFVGTPSGALIGTMAFITIMVLSTVVTVLLLQSDAERLHLSLPTRMMRLPLATWRIVLPLMMYGALTAATVSAVATCLIKLVLSTTFPWWLPVCLAVCAMAVAQAWALAWGDANPKTGATVLLLGFASVIGLLQLGLSLLNESNTILEADAVYEAHFAYLLPVTLAVVGLSLAVAVAGVSLNRHGGIPDWTSLLRLNPKRITSLSESKARRFRSAKQAQLWYDWRCFGWQLPLAIFVGLGLYFLGMPLLVAVMNVTNVTGQSSVHGFAALFAVDWLTSPQFVTTGFQVSALMGAVLAGAYLFMKAGNWNTESTFLLALPMSTPALARTRISLVFRSSLLGLGVLMAALGVIALIVGARGESLGILDYLVQGYEEIPRIGVLAFFWGGLFLFMWVAVWAVNVGWALLAFAIALVPAVVGAGVAGAAGAVPMPDPAAFANTAWDICTWAAAALLIAATLWAYRAGRTRGLLGPHVKWMIPLLWLVYSGAFTIFGRTFYFPPDARLPNPFPHPIDWSLWLALSMLPIAPMITHPLLLHRARHR